MSKPPVHWSYAEQRYWINTPDGVEWFDGPLEAEDAAAVIDRHKAAQQPLDIGAQLGGRTATAGQDPN